jgi:uncharacterized protein
MDPIGLINKYYLSESKALRILLLHSQSVTRKAVSIAIRLKLSTGEIDFIREAAMLHDIGILYTHAPEIGCTGKLPYICHGFMGHDLLVSEGLPMHALVCERHTGAGLSIADIDRFDGLLPHRPMEPISQAEKLIAYCDKFFSKDPKHIENEKTFDEAFVSVAKFGENKGKIFREWHLMFSL